MDSCCNGKESDLAALRERQRGVLQIVFAINLVLFGVEVAGALVARSTALLSDSLDMLGDASVYFLTLYALERGPVWRARAVLAKGGLMAVLGTSALVGVGYQVVTSGAPEPTRMGGIGVLALLANLACLALLLRHRRDDLNMRSTWLCSRNDIIANVGVLGAAGLVALFDRGWPDYVVGALIAVLFLRSAVTVITEGRLALQSAPGESA
jgi:Co/Zn/Cd efflux system component